MPPALNLLGALFGRLVVVAGAPRIGAQLAWRCRCRCGGEISTTTNSLRMGKTRSCGCLQKEAARVGGALFDGAANVRHGKAGTAVYAVWKTMRQRCTNPRSPDYADYGGRGIRVCARWESFENFLADMGPRPPGKSIDRIDNERGYEPGNCRWATSAQQALNRRPRRQLSKEETACP